MDIKHLEILPRAIPGNSAFAIAALLIISQLLSADTGKFSYADDIDAIFGETIKSDTPGCVVAVYDHGDTVFARGYGLANLEHEVPMTRESAFRIASLSKQFTALAAIIAGRHGFFSLDDDVRKHIPELPQYGKTITIRHLLWHTSGIRSDEGLFRLAGRPQGEEHSPADLIAMITRQEGLNFTPGTNHSYSNSGLPPGGGDHCSNQRIIIARICQYAYFRAAGNESHLLFR